MHSGVGIEPYSVNLKAKNTKRIVSGNAPAVIAKGGFSGIFPDSSEPAYKFSMLMSSPDTILYCDVRLTSDGIGICLSDIKMDNCTNVADLYPQGKKSYLVNGVPTVGWFSVDYNSTELEQVYRKCYLSYSSMLDCRESPSACFHASTIL
jgi:glycerophosphoryl diester phosphodiesterase